MLDEQKAIDATVGELDALLHNRHPGALEILSAPHGEIAMRRRADGVEELLPRPVAERMRLEEVVHAELERGLAYQMIELLEHTRRLVVHDRAVVALRLIEVRELLPHGSRSR